MADRGPVKIRQGSIDDLISVYQRTYLRMIQEITKASEAGKINKARVMLRINAELETLGVAADEWAKTQIPQYYLDGANAAIQDLRALNVDVSKSAQFAVINREAIKALTDEVALNFANGITAISRNVRRILDDTLKRQLNMTIAEGKLTGDTRKEISAALEKRLKDEGITSITDRAGRDWSFDRYTEMLARTKAVESRNQGLVNRMLASGYDLVQVTNHHTDHQACAEWEGRILSLTGKTKGFPTLQNAVDSGLFHPNCKHAINVIIEELAEKTIAYDNPYNYDAPAAKPGSTPKAKGGGKLIEQEVFHGEGKNVLPPGNNMFGNAFYVAPDKDTAKVFGTPKAYKMKLREGELLKVNSQEDYQRFVNEALARYPGEDAQISFPKYARSLGYRAVQVDASFDDLGGIAILDKSILV